MPEMKLKEWGISLNKLIGWSPDYEKPKEHTNKLKVHNDGKPNEQKKNIGRT